MRAYIYIYIYRIHVHIFVKVWYECVAKSCEKQRRERLKLGLFKVNLRRIFLLVAKNGEYEQINCCKYLHFTYRPLI